MKKALNGVGMACVAVLGHVIVAHPNTFEIVFYAAMALLCAVLSANSESEVRRG